MRRIIILFGFATLMHSNNLNISLEAQLQLDKLQYIKIQNENMCDRNNAKACLDLASMYEKGEFTLINKYSNKKSESEYIPFLKIRSYELAFALSLYSKACTLNNKQACKYFDSLRHRVKIAKFQYE